MRLSREGSQTIWYDDAGQGDAVILLHSALGDHRQWNPQWETLQKHFRVTRYDARGYGRSSDADGPIDPADDLLALLDHLKLERAHLVGSSMGGTTALHAALSFPHRVGKIALMGTGILGFDPDALESSIPLDIEEAYHRAISEGDHEALIDVSETIWLVGIEGTNRDVPESARMLFRTMNREQLTLHPPGGPEYLPGRDVERLEHLKTPTLVIIGDRDTAYCRRAAEILAARAPQVQLHTMSAGHFPNLTRPDEVSAVLMDFLHR